MSYPKSEEELLDEFWAIRKEYNSLDKTNPDHLPRRTELKERYRELDRMYGGLIARGEAKHRDELLPDATSSPWQPPKQEPEQKSSDQVRKLSFGFGDEVTPLPEKSEEDSDEFAMPAIEDDAPAVPEPGREDAFGLDAIDLSRATEQPDTDTETDEPAEDTSEQAGPTFTVPDAERIQVPKSGFDPSLRRTYSKPDTPPGMIEKLGADDALTDEVSDDTVKEYLPPLDVKWSGDSDDAEEPIPMGVFDGTDRNTGAESARFDVGAPEAADVTDDGVRERSAGPEGELRTTLNSLEAELDEKSRAAADAQARLESLLDEGGDAARTWDAEKRAFAERNAQLVEELEKKDEGFRKTDEEMNRLRSEQDQQRKIIEELELRLSEKESALAAADARVAAHHERERELKDGLAGLEEDLTALREEVDRINQSRDSMKAEMERMQLGSTEKDTALREARAELEALRASKTDLSDRIKSAEEKAASKDAEAARLRADAAAGADRAEILKSELASVRGELRDTVAERDTLRQDVHKLRAEHQASEARLKEAHAVLSEKDGEIRTLSGKLESSNVQLQDATAKRDELASLVEEMKAAAARREQEQDDLVSQVAELEGELDAKTYALRNAKKQVINMKRRFSLDPNTPGDDASAASDQPGSLLESIAVVRAEELQDDLVESEAPPPRVFSTKKTRVSASDEERPEQTEKGVEPVEESRTTGKPRARLQALEDDATDVDTSRSKRRTFLIGGGVALVAGLLFITAYGLGFSLPAGGESGGQDTGVFAAALGVVFTLLGSVMFGFGLLHRRARPLDLVLHELAADGLAHEIERELDERPVDINLMDDRGYTPLHVAAAAGHLPTVQLLVARGAQLELKTPVGETALHLAAAARHRKIVEHLIDKGANVHTCNHRGSTLMHVASWAGDEELIRMLHDRGLDADAAGKTGYTPLHFAAQAGHVEAVRLLLEYGADIDSKSSKGKTPLYAASKNGHVNIVQLLLERGADRGQPSQETDLNPVNIARENGHWEVVELLQTQTSATDA